MLRLVEKKFAAVKKDVAHCSLRYCDPLKKNVVAIDFFLHTIYGDVARFFLVFRLYFLFFPNFFFLYVGTCHREEVI